MSTTFLKRRRFELCNSRLPTGKKENLNRSCIYLIIRAFELQSKKNRKHNCQRENYNNTNNDLQNIHIKLKIE
jgi:hypothetical protein